MRSELWVGKMERRARKEWKGKRVHALEERKWKKEEGKVFWPGQKLMTLSHVQKVGGKVCWKIIFGWKVRAENDPKTRKGKKVSSKNTSLRINAVVGERGKDIFIWFEGNLEVDKKFGSDGGETSKMVANLKRKRKTTERFFSWRKKLSLRKRNFPKRSRQKGELFLYQRQLPRDLIRWNFPSGKIFGVGEGKKGKARFHLDEGNGWDLTDSTATASYRHQPFSSLFQSSFHVILYILLILLRFTYWYQKKITYTFTFLFVSGNQRNVCRQ